MKVRLVWCSLLCLAVAGCAATTVTGQGSVAVSIHTPAPPPRTKHAAPRLASPSLPSPTPSPAPQTSTAAPPSWASVYREVSSGVVRIDVANCNETGTGTGFLIAPDLVATVAHVVEGMGPIRVTAPNLALATAAHVVGVSHDHDLALLQTSTPIPGHIFRLSGTTPPIGTAMAAIGFSLGGSMQLSPGTITGTHDHREVGGTDTTYDLSDVLLTDAAVNPGNSGGPWLTLDGQVIALTESGPPYSSEGQPAEGNNGGVSAVDAAAHFNQWSQYPQTAPPGPCSTPANSEQAALFTLFVYFEDIDTSDYASAYAQHDDATPQGLASFIAGVETSQDTSTHGSSLFTEDASGVDQQGRFVDATFESHQDADHAPAHTGMTCTIWHIRYHFTITRGLALIHNALAEPGHQLYQAC